MNRTRKIPQKGPIYTETPVSSDYNSELPDIGKNPFDTSFRVNKSVPNNIVPIPSKQVPYTGGISTNTYESFHPISSKFIPQVYNPNLMPAQNISDDSRVHILDPTNAKTCSGTTISPNSTVNPIINSMRSGSLGSTMMNSMRPNIVNPGSSMPVIINPTPIPVPEPDAIEPNIPDIIEPCVTSPETTLSNNSNTVKPDHISSNNSNVMVSDRILSGGSNVYIITHQDYLSGNMPIGYESSPSTSLVHYHIIGGKGWQRIFGYTRGTNLQPIIIMKSSILYGLSISHSGIGSIQPGAIFLCQNNIDIHDNSPESSESIIAIIKIKTELTIATNFILFPNEDNEFASWELIGNTMKINKGDKISLYANNLSGANLELYFGM